MQNVLPWKRAHVSLVPGTSTSEEAGATRATDASARPSLAPVAVSAVGPESDTVSVDAIALSSLASLAARCALVVCVMGAIAAAVLWIVAAALGIVGSFESFMESVGFRDFHLSGLKIVAGATLVVAGFALAVSVLILVCGAVYNLLAAHGGGLEVHLAGLDPRTASVAEDPAATALVAAPEDDPAA